MQLNNTNGKVIILDKIDILQNRIVYSVYEYGGGQVLEQKALVFTTINLKDYLGIETNFEALCYTKLVEEKETDFVISEDVQNWTIVKGSTSENTTLRVYIPSNLTNKVLNTGNDLDILIKAMSPLAEWVNRLVNGSMQYLEFLEPEAKVILEEYPEIIIENKD